MQQSQQARPTFEEIVVGTCKFDRDMSHARFPGNTFDNPNNETCKVIELRSRTVHKPVSSKTIIKEEREVVEGEVKNNFEVEKMGETIWELIDKDSILRNSN